MDTVLQYALQEGQPPSIPQHATWRPRPPQRSRSHQWKVLPDGHIKRMKQASNKKVRPCEFQGDLMLKEKVIIFQSESRGKEMLNHKGWWRTLSSCEFWCSQEIHCQKKNSSISCKPEKGDLGKNERLGGLKTRKGSPAKVRDIQKWWKWLPW